MQLAQRLYEGVDIGGESRRPDHLYADRRRADRARGDRRGAPHSSTKLYGDRYVPASPRQYETKAKNAQEAHEAIRPTDFTKAPDKVARYLDGDAAKLYKLIWQRTLASQASSAEIERTTAEIDVTGNDGEAYGLRATGSVIRFDGFLKLYEEGPDDAVGEDGALPRARHRAITLDAAQDRGEAAFHRAAAPLHRGEPHQEDGGARHRPALDLCLDAQRAARPRICPARQEAASSRGQGPPGHRLPRELLQPLRRIRLHRRPRGEARPDLGRRARTGRTCSATSGASSSPRCTTSAICASPRCSTR